MRLTSCADRASDKIICLKKKKTISGSHSNLFSYKKCHCSHEYLQRYTLFCCWIMSDACQSTQLCESAETKGHEGPDLFQLSGSLSRCLSEVQLHRLRHTDWWMMAIHQRRHHPRNARHVVEDKLDMDLEAMDWEICFKEQEINIEGKKEGRVWTCRRKTVNLCVRWTCFSFKCLYFIEVLELCIHEYQ